MYEIEKKTRTDKKFQFPSFEMINWFAASYLLNQLIDINQLETRCPDYLLVGMKALLQCLKHWNNEKDVSCTLLVGKILNVLIFFMFQYNLTVREQIPFIPLVPKLIKDIAKEIRHAERYINHLNPPKPERESKRKRKKPVNKDFVDYSLSPKSTPLEVIYCTAANLIQ